MKEFLLILTSFITGGGISTILSLRFLNKANKLDYTDKAISFIEKQYDHVVQQNKELQDRVTALECLIPLVCFNKSCKNRQKQKLKLPPNDNE